MTADQIRKISFPKYEQGNPPSEVHEFFGAMLQEFVAQIAELNANLRAPKTVVNVPADPWPY
jgi:hypothetical protein